MTNNNEDIIDLTSSFNLANHHSLNNVFIDLDTTDESFRQDQVIIHESITLNDRTRNPSRKKRRSTKPRTNNTTVTNGPLLLPEEKNNKKNPKKNIKIHEKLPEEPQEKKLKCIGCCPICLDDFGTKPLSSTKCGHVFCTNCIKLALKGASTCPQCRSRLRGASAIHPLFLSGN